MLFKRQAEATNKILIDMIKKCNTLPSPVPCLSHSTTLRSCYYYINRPCLTATFDRLQHFNQLCLGRLSLISLELSGDNMKTYIEVRITKFSVGFPRLPHIASS